MFDILFGWRKASKCKKLIRNVQCRLKLLKNKRCSIVRQLRDDVGQLLKHGHDQSAFDRVEQLIKDENIVSVYDLLDHFCEFVIIHLSYIRKHKDCPNDINEAVSTLIFASARCGDLPELPLIRKLFGERYGQRFATVALELLPGNLVNRQIKENLSIKSVPNDVKYRLVDEIARSCLQQGPLSLEYYPQVQQEEISKNKGDQFLSSVVQTKCDTIEESELDTFEVMETEGKIVYVDFASDEKKLQTEPFHLNQGSESTGTLTLSSTVMQSSQNSVYNHLNTPCEFIKPGQCTAITLSSNGTHNLPSDHEESDMDVETSSEISSQLPKEMIYLDDIEEFKSPMSKDDDCQDQRLFMFKSSVIPNTDKLEDGFSEGYSRSTRKSRNTSGKRQRRRSISRESRSAKDVESTIYYDDCKSHQQRKHQKKIPLDESQKSHCAQARLDQPCQVHTINSFRSGDHGRVVHECSLEHPCYICHCHCFCSGNLNKRELEWDILHGEPRREYPIDDKLASPRARKVTPPPYLRVMTMPPQRPSNCHAENILRSNSFPFQQHGSSGCGHVHPKLPDYDQLAAKFTALKKENLQQKSQG